MAPLGLLYCIAILTNVLGMPRAVLRLFDRYGLTVMRDVAVFGLRLVFVVMLYFWDAPDQSFVLAWLAAEVAGNVGLVLMAFRELHRHHFRQILGANASAAVRTLPGFWTTMWSTNLIGGIRIASQEGDVLLVGAILGPTAAGTFKVAKSLASLLAQVGNAVQQSVFPDIARLWAEGRVTEFRTFSRQVNWLAGGMGLLCLAAAWPVAAPLVRLTAGDDYLAAAPAFVVQVAVHVIGLFGVTFLPMATSLGKMPDLLKIHAAASLLFFAAVPVVLPSVGVVGAALGHLLYMAVWWIAAHLSIQGGLRTAELVGDGDGVSRPEGVA
jgi:O-antigen/teichoic acid export membrane protein